MTKLHNIAATLLLGTVISSTCISNIVYAQEASAEPSWELRVTEDAESLIKLIGKYIKKKHEMRGNYQFDDNGDMYLYYDLFKGEPLQVRYVIVAPATNSSNDGGKKIITERRVRVSAYVFLPENARTNEGRRAINELNNKWMNSTWVPHRLYIQSKGYIAMQSTINIPGKDYPVHAELIDDILVRTSIFWKKYHKDLTGVLESLKM